MGDNQDRAVAALKLALGRSDLVFTIGGLGPTLDDMTRDAVAEATGQALIEDPALVEGLKALFQSRGVATVKSQFRQAMRPSGAVPLPNENGTAPGLWCPVENKVVVCLPGPRNEFSAMLHGPVKAKLAALAGHGAISSRTLRVFGMGEAALAEQIDRFLQGEDVTVAPYAKIGEVHLRLTTKAATHALAQAKLDPVAQQLRETLGDLVYGEGDGTLEEYVVHALAAKSLKVATVESCTGGMLGATLTRVDGSSKVYLGGFVTYSPDQKQAMVGVTAQTLAKFGTVSAETAEEMAAGGRAKTGADICVSITGVAGGTALEEPGGQKPQGLFFIGVSSRLGSRSARHQWRGDRETVRLRAVALALHETRLEGSQI